VKSEDREYNPATKPELNQKGRRNMKKTLLASAIAAATFSGSVVAMQTASELAERMDSMPQVYGNVQIAYTYENSDENGDGNKLFDNGSTIGLTHEHEIAPGVTAFGKIELQGFDTTEKGDDDNGLNELDEAYIGIKGDSFGQVWVGSDDSRYEALLGDYGNTIYEIATLNPYNSATTGEDDQIQYVSPSFGGLTLHAGIQINGEDEGVKSYPYQLGASYSMDALTVSLVMDSNDGAVDDSNENSYGLAAEYALGDLVLDAYFDMRSGVDGSGQNGNEQMGYMATYNMGANTFRVSYEMADADIGNESTDVIMFQALHNVGDNMYVYIEGGQKNIDPTNEEINQINVGSVYYF
jgi:predicted porin